MSWSELFLVFWISHLAGDYLLQTEWQARHKSGGLGSDRVARRALLAHLFIYTLAFVPALIWLGDDRGAATAIAAGAAISISHLVLDDGRLLTLYMRRVKGCADPPSPGLFAAVDQSCHVIILWLVAVVAG
jgi:hypothetical protein